MKVPILFTIFNRVDVAIAAFQAIRAYQPDRIYIAGDGPRKKKKGEAEQVEITRKAILNLIDWPCQINTLFQNENLGCANGMYTAISWFFSNEEWGIVCEDDIVLSHDFYQLCELVLPLYANDENVMQVTAWNNAPSSQQSAEYVFTNQGYCWGWASWARAWKLMDFEMKTWRETSWWILMKNQIRSFGWFHGLFTFFTVSRSVANIESWSSWAGRWNISIWQNNGLVLIPRVLLAENIGMSIEGAHYGDGEENRYAHLHKGKLEYPIRIPPKVEFDIEQIKAERKDFWRVRMIGLNNKLHKLLH